jgi:hypothetical protein
MPYGTHPLADTPPDDSSIWRYMDLPKFLLLLDHKALYFPLLSELADRWEAVLDHAMRNYITGHFLPAASGGVVDSLRDFVSRGVVNCWYLGETESVAMWTLYTGTPYGIAIKSTVGRLKTAMRAYNRYIYLGRVKYVDHEAISTSLAPAVESLNAFRTVLQERLCYKHECELRAFTVFPTNEPAPTHGVKIPVGLRDLIDSVTLDPPSRLGR